MTFKSRWREFVAVFEARQLTVSNGINFVLLLTTAGSVAIGILHARSERQRDDQKQFSEIIRDILETTEPAFGLAQTVEDNIEMLPTGPCAPIGPMQLDEIQLQHLEVYVGQACKLVNQVESAEPLDILVLAQSLCTLGRYDQSRQYAELVLSTNRTDLHDRVRANVVLAQIDFSNGDPTKARERLTSTKELIAAMSSQRAERDMLQAKLLLAWASAEIYFQTDSRNTQELVIEANTLAQSLPLTPGVVDLRNRTHQMSHAARASASLRHVIR